MSALSKKSFQTRNQALASFLTQRPNWAEFAPQAFLETEGLKGAGGAGQSLGLDHILENRSDPGPILNIFFAG